MIDKVYKVLKNQLFERVSMVDIKTFDGFNFVNAILVKDYVLTASDNTLYIYRLGDDRENRKTSFVTFIEVETYYQLFFELGKALSDF